MREILELATPRHISEWLQLLGQHRQLVVEASRDHAKSWTFSYVWPLFNIQKCMDPKQPVNIALLSYSEEQSKKNLARIRKSIETNPFLKWLQPKLKSYTWSDSKLECSNNCTVESFGFGSSIRGGHYHIFLIDDPTKDHFTMSLAEQENFLYGVVLPAVRRGGQIVVCGNPVEKQDLLERLENNAEWKTFKYPAWNERQEPLWPDQYTLEDLKARQRAMPAHLFSREYLLKRVSAADAKFKEEWIKYYEDSELVGKALYRIMTIDPAFSPGGDKLAAVVTGTDRDGNVYVLDRLGFRGDFKAGISELCDMIAKWMPDFLGTETFAFQHMYKVWLEEELNRRGIIIHIEALGTDTKKSKAARIEALQPKLAQGKLKFKREHQDTISELLSWDPASKHNQDDEIDALAYQVPLWQVPGEDDAPVLDIKPGSFQEAFEDIRDGNSESFIHRLFNDLQ